MSSIESDTSSALNGTFFIVAIVTIAIVLVIVVAVICVGLKRKQREEAYDQHTPPTPGAAGSASALVPQEQRADEGERMRDAHDCAVAQPASEDVAEEVVRNGAIDGRERIVEERKRNHVLIEPTLGEDLHHPNQPQRSLRMNFTASIWQHVLQVASVIDEACTVGPRRRARSIRFESWT